MDYLVGKCLKATSEVSLLYKMVDGNLCTSSTFYIPSIYPDSYLLVKQVKGQLVILQNLSSDDWTVCELTLEDIEDFKVVSKDEI